MNIFIKLRNTTHRFQYRKEVYKLNLDNSLICPKCNNKYFEMKREATYLYTYKINSPVTNSWSDNDETLPFLFDNREQTSSQEYLECIKCGAKYPCTFNKDTQSINLTILRKAIRADHKDSPEFLG